MTGPRFLLNSFVSISVRAFGALTGVIFSFVLARNFSVNEVGIFYTCFAIVTLLSTLCRFGSDNFLLKEVAAATTAPDFNKVNLTFTSTVFLITIFSSLVSFLSFIVVEFILVADTFSLVFKFFLIFLLPLSLYTSFSFYFQAIGKTIVSIFLLNIFVNVVSVLFLCFFNIEELSYFVLIYCLVGMFNFALSLFIWHRIKGNFLTFSQSVVVDTYQVFKLCIPFFLVSVSSQVSQWSGQVFLSITSEATDVAFFSISQRCAFLVSFVLMAVNLVMAPKFSKLYAENKLHELRFLVRSVIRLILVISLPIVSVVIFYPDTVLSVFGENFKGASSTLVVLALGQFFNAVTGPVGFLLSMTGNVNIQKNVSIFTVLLLLLGFVILIPFYGSLGAACSVTFSITVQNVVCAYYVYKVLGINVLKIL